MSIHDKEIQNFLKKPFPSNKVFTDELWEWLFDYLVPLDSYCGSCIMKYQKGLPLSLKDKHCLKKSFTDTKSKLDKIMFLIDKRDTEALREIVQYLDNIKNISRYIQ